MGEWDQKQHQEQQTNKQKTKTKNKQKTDGGLSCVIKIVLTNFVQEVTVEFPCSNVFRFVTLQLSSPHGEVFSSQILPDAKPKSSFLGSTEHHLSVKDFPQDQFCSGTFRQRAQYRRQS